MDGGNLNLFYFNIRDNHSILKIPNQIVEFNSTSTVTILQA